MRCGSPPKIITMLTKRRIDAGKKESALRQISIRIHLRAINTFKVFTFNERFNSLLDHVDFWLELLG
jgi:hypothetical protein